MLTALPLFHVNGQGMTILAAMTVGGTAIVIEEFSASRFWEQVKRHKATQTAVVAMQLRALIAQPDDPGGPRARRAQALLRDQRLRPGEGSLRGALRDRGDQRLRPERGDDPADRLAGRGAAPLALDRPALAGPHAAAARRGRQRGADRRGRRDLRPRRCPAARSCSATTRTSRRPPQTIRGDLLHTGDNAYADEQGYLYFFDRKKDMIKRAGENVSAIEVESVLADHPQVAEAAIVGMPDPIRDEAVAAVIVVADGRRADRGGDRRATAPSASPASRSRPSSPSSPSCRKPRSARSARTSCARSSPEP